MAVNLNSSPYYDDYDQDKNYQRILFKPGVSVQSRELNQIQSILHNGISKTADGIYGDNARITNSPTSFTILSKKYGQSIYAIKVQGAGTNITSYVGKYLTGVTTKTIGIIKFAYEKDDPALGDPATFIIQVETFSGPIEFSTNEVLRIYDTLVDAKNKNSNFIATYNAEFDITINATASVSAFEDEINFGSLSAALKVGDRLNISEDYGTNLYVTKIISNNTVRLSSTIKQDIPLSLNFNFERKNTCPTSIVGVSSGTYYKKGYFVKVDNQSIVPDKYTDFPTKSIILKYSESIVDFTEDTSLLDPAFESSNYLAPGADRFKTTLTIASVDLDSNNMPDTTDDYVEVVRLIEGREEFAENTKNYLPIYLNNILAERTYDESGNYLIRPFNLVPRGSTASDTYAKFNIKPGKAMVGGQSIETTGDTELLIPKSKTYSSESDIFINANQDEYVIIDNPSFGYTDPTRIKLFDVLEAHSTTDRTAMSSSTLVGFIIVKHIIYDSGEGNNKRYRLYPYWYYQNSSTLGIRNIKSFISKQNVFSTLVNNTGTYNSPNFFANVNSTKGLEVVNGNSLMLGFELGSRKRAIFPVDAKYLKSISNIRIYHSKKIENQSVSSSTVTVSLSGTEYFIGNAGTINVDTKRRHYQLLVKSTSSGSLAVGQPIDVDAITMSLDADKQNLTIGLSSLLVTGSIDLYVTIYNNELGRKTKLLNINVATEPIRIANSGIPYDVFKSDIYSLKGIYAIGSNLFHREFNSSITYAENDYVMKDGLMYKAKTSSTGQAITNSTYWAQVSKEPESLYTFDYGHRDTFYDHAYVTYNGNLSLYNPGNVVLILDNFSHSGSGVIDFSSYPTIIQNTIPLFKSEDGTVFNLRNCLDFRPKKNDTNVAANFWADNNSNTYLIPNPVLENSVQLDFEYYLPRIDRLYLTNRNASKENRAFNFYLDPGLPSITPKTPVDASNKDKLLIATLVVPPFTKNSTDISVFYNKSPRYTMGDISTIDKRLTNLEKRVKKQGLDIVALNNQIFDGGNTANLLFKTGILVDDFSGVVANDIREPHSTCLVDPINKELRPPFSVVRHGLFFENQPDLNIEYDIVTFKYTEESFISVSETTLVQDTTTNKSVPATIVVNPESIKGLGSGSLSAPVVIANGLDNSLTASSGGKIGTDNLFSTSADEKQSITTFVSENSGSQVGVESVGSQMISNSIRNLTQDNPIVELADNTDNSITYAITAAANDIAGEGLKSVTVGLAENLQIL